MALSNLRILLWILILLTIPGFVLAQDQTADDSSFLEEENLLFADEELVAWINTEISVASKVKLTPRESPGIISFITAEEIANAGARDLMDVLRLVPGFHFGVDVQGAVGLGMRGNWGHEGKILLLWDGIQLNETLYSTTNFGNHFPVDQIKKVEIIRGPGSPLYGGYAELAVINIITNSAKDLNGVHLTGAYGQMADTFARRNFGLQFGRQLTAAGQISAALFIGQGNRSDHDYTDVFGYSYNMQEEAELNPLYANLGIEYEKLTVRFLADRFHTTDRDAFDEALSVDSGYTEAPDLFFNTYGFNAAYEYQLTSKIKLSPEVNFTHQEPWLSNELDPADLNFSDKYTQRLRGTLTLDYDLTEKINALAGIEFFNDRAVASKKVLPEEWFVPNEDRTINYSNFALIGQTLFRNILRHSHLTVGARYDKHEDYGSSFVPRMALTNLIGRFHFKLLYSQAFRAPAIANIQKNRLAINMGVIEKEIEPEETAVFELEAGYQLTKNALLVANAYDIRIDEPIVYVYDDELEIEYYKNFDKTGTRGIEIEGRYFDEWGQLVLGYSFYQINENNISDYAVSADDQLLLAFPAHKLSLNSHFRLNPQLSINPSGIFFSKRYGYVTEDQAENETPAEFDPVFLVNCYFRYTNVIPDKLDIGLGVYNILDETDWFIQPYNGYHAPLPGISREIYLKLTWRHSF